LCEIATLTANPRFDSDRQQRRCAPLSPAGQSHRLGVRRVVGYSYKRNGGVTRFALRVTFAISAVLAATFAGADEVRTIPTVGIAVPIDPVTDVPYNTALREGLRELGYVDGKNVILAMRYANGDAAKYPAIIRELVALHVDILIGEAGPLKEATTTIPIVSPTMSDTVKTGLVASLAHPGGNLTGVSAQSYDIWPKQLDLAKEVVPNLRRMSLLFDVNDQRDSLAYAKEFADLARGIGISVRSFPVGTLGELQTALATIRKERPQLLMVWSSALMIQYRRTIVDAVAHKLPVMSDGRFLGEAGALLTYSVDYLDMFRRSAAYVDKILKGAKPGDLPIEQPTKFKLLVNLKTARALGITIPDALRVRTDEVIR
jgi:putative tryptophan/tyrosine transport system substrate-binding protein